jgi:hypothetical protein
VGTPSSRRNSNPLSWNKAIRNIPLDVQDEMKNSQYTKMIYHVIKSGVSRKRGTELSNRVLTLVRLQKDSTER